LLAEGMILDLSPAKIPRVIGRSGSMINMIKDKLRIEAVVAQNGRIWIRAPDTSTLNLAIKAFKMIEVQAHTSKLTERIGAMLDQELADMKERAPEMTRIESEEETRAPVKAEPPEEEPEPLVEEKSAEEAMTAPTEEPAESKASDEEPVPAEEAEVAKDNDNTTEEVIEE